MILLLITITATILGLVVLAFKLLRGVGEWKHPLITKY